jgi:hypothetical protein
MNQIETEAILGHVTRYYLDSRDFNGISARELAEAMEIEWGDLKEALSTFIREEKICILYTDWDVNTHIKRVGHEAIYVQISKLDTGDLVHTFVYPLPRHLETVVDRSQYEDNPYTLCLALGEPQLSFRAFDLSILEHYRNDPRYYYRNDDIRGSISVRDIFCESGEIAPRDRVFLQTFGFCYDQDFNRAVAVFLRYLAQLRPEQQQLWKTRELGGNYKLHPDYYRNAIEGGWGEKVPIFRAFTAELNTINKMAEAMGRSCFFKDDFVDNRPKKFGFLVRPTLEEFNDFVLLLDKMISENINLDFFENEVPYETERLRNDGRVVVQRKSALTILNDWIHRSFEIEDWTPIDEMIQTFKRIRRLRQRPAHAVDENVFDQRYFREQRQLIIAAYKAIKTVRVLFELHPMVHAGSIAIPPYLRDRKIWTM